MIEKELFVVQRCWHSGPQQYQPLDYHRLFLSQRDAEESAYHSAHAWAKYHNPGKETTVRTLMLPAYPAHNTNGTSYGFIANGCLFWVRSLMATVQSDNMEACAIVTEGVIGGTGNKNSRRGTETPTGRVFIGDSNFRFTALEHCHKVMATLPQNCNTSLVTLAIGKPEDYHSEQFLHDWPPQVLQPKLSMTVSSGLQKRESHWIQEEMQGTFVECPFETPNPKRRRVQVVGNYLGGRW